MMPEVVVHQLPIMKRIKRKNKWVLLQHRALGVRMTREMTGINREMVRNILVKDFGKEKFAHVLSHTS